jgi:hypothetical protein
MAIAVSDSLHLIPVVANTPYEYGVVGTVAADVQRPASDADFQVTR